MRYPNTCASTRRTAARTHIAGHFASFRISARKLDRMFGLLTGELEEHVLERSLQWADLAHRDPREHELAVDQGAVRGIGVETKRSVHDLDASASQQPLGAGLRV